MQGVVPNNRSGTSGAARSASANYTALRAGRLENAQGVCCLFSSVNQLGVTAGSLKAPPGLNLSAHHPKENPENKSRRRVIRRLHASWWRQVSETTSSELFVDSYGLGHACDACEPIMTYETVRGGSEGGGAEGRRKAVAAEGHKGVPASWRPLGESGLQRDVSQSENTERPCLLWHLVTSADHQAVTGESSYMNVI